MRLVSYNVQYGLGRDGRYDLARIAREIREADVACLQEVERFWERSGTVDEPAVLAEHLPDHHWVYGANFDVDADHRDAATGRLVHRRRQFGTMVLSRWPIRSSRNHLLPKLGAVNQHSIQQGALEAVIAAPFGPFRVYSVHLSHLCSGTRLPQVEALLAIHRRAPGEGGAWCGSHPNPAAGWTEGGVYPMPRSAAILGDLNFMPHEPEYERFVGPLSATYGRVTPLEGFVDAWVQAGHGEAEGVTTADGKRLDYVLLTPDLAARVRGAWIDTAAQGSDHLPMWAELDPD